MNILEMAKAAGLNEDDLKGKSLDQQIKLITQQMKKEKENLEIENAKEYINNFQKKIPKIKEFFEKPVEIYVKKAAQKKTPTVVKVIGFNSETSEIVVYYGGKNISIPNDDLITTLEDLEKSKSLKPAKENKTGKKGKK